MAERTPDSPESTDLPEGTDLAEHADSSAEQTAQTAKQDSTWATCCGVVTVVLVLLLGLGAWGVSELEKGLDGYGQVESGDTGPDGSVADPFGPGGSARYEDGLDITVDEGRGEQDGRVRHFNLTFENGTDDTVQLGGTTNGDDVYEALDVRAGRPLDDNGPDDGSTSDWLGSEEALDALRAPLRADETRTVPLRVTGDTKGMAITVEVMPQDDEYRDTVYWHLTLD